MQDQQQKFIFIEGNVNTSRYFIICRDNSIDHKKTVFIFPGNTTHNKKQMLLTTKRGNGLAKVAEDLGPYMVPTLSLPTRFMPTMTKDKAPDLAYKAIADLWKAAGYGCHFVLPIRHKNQCYEQGGKTIFYSPYFGEDGLDESNLSEPNFWGLFERTPNIELGKYYLQELKKLINFLNNPGQKPPSEFEEAYREGQNAIIAPTLWFTHLGEIESEYTPLLRPLFAGDNEECCCRCVLF